MTQKTQGIKKAVALKYAPDISAAPKLIAKGKGRLAESIMEKARENGVPIQEDPSLVEVLSKLDLDQEIPPELYKLVAEVLTFIYRSDQKAKQWRGEGG
ncbi:MULTISPECIES: EscU/YscU/HrcU family type III secretion system export apparatus switch protein [Paenibacillus]|uniref:FhlB domain-containing protein n=1 Tax=Paenibacillus naphthalenovorans TaxID=162209 RepID=A0A0U2M2Q3_9BACL|nr:MULTISPECIES: EscU/YscU/HrcU family type III secretion system export apparatus switch protein [Paenibacillus]ALS21616.1 FhlB domain-containing protein [Paenibacillus naphthalenovorans]GCL71343.1 FhlB domain-containing protein [Paenibacillus naphthalenovorans]SDI86496.1 flagellar biosynthesis protein [Paenibacillus naphthalenovorans]